jgi:peptide deformylase
MIKIQNRFVLFLHFFMTSQLLTIAQLGNPILRKTAIPVVKPTTEAIQTLVSQMIGTLTQSQGVGLAAPQVEQSQRLVIVASHPNTRYPDAPTMAPMALINPQILDRSDRQARDWEGCLSIPGIRGLVPRCQWVEVEFVDPQGRSHRQRFEGFVARIFQHEFDHLEGKVFLDRVESSLDLMSESEWQTRMAPR